MTHVPGNLAVLCNLEALGAEFTQHFGASSSPAQSS